VGFFLVLIRSNEALRSDFRKSENRREKTNEILMGLLRIRRKPYSILFSLPAVGLHLSWIQGFLRRRPPPDLWGRRESIPAV